MPLDIGPGVKAWLDAHSATPLSDEVYLPPDFRQSAVAILIANAEGQAVRALVGFDKATGRILDPGPGVLVPQPIRTAYDSTTAADIPADAEMVMGYVDGDYAWSEEDWARFPTAVKVRITISAANLDADMLDVESGDATPAQAAQWILSGPHTPRPAIYCNLSTKPAVDAGFAANVKYEWFAADPTGEPHFVDGSIGTQYAWPGIGSPGHYDISLVRAGWPS
ncbi:MAG: hypothetical protein KGL39_11920 [Patescibacteria group bacterium]|nr:hypothetical protein [Patescibacteria group bacterium]